MLKVNQFVHNQINHSLGIERTVSFIRQFVFCMELDVVIVPIARLKLIKFGSPSRYLCIRAFSNRALHSAPAKLWSNRPHRIIYKFAAK